MGIEYRQTIYTCDICGAKKESYRKPPTWVMFGLCTHADPEDKLKGVHWWGGDWLLTCDKCWGKNLPSKEADQKQKNIILKLWDSIYKPKDQEGE